MAQTINIHINETGEGVGGFGIEQAAEMDAPSPDMAEVSSSDSFDDAPAPEGADMSQIGHDEAPSPDMAEASTSDSFDDAPEPEGDDMSQIGHDQAPGPDLAEISASENFDDAPAPQTQSTGNDAIDLSDDVLPSPLDG